MRIRLGAILAITASLMLGQQQIEPAAKKNESGASVVLAPNDRLMITCADVAGIDDAPYGIDADGTVSLPLIGKVRAAGLTIEQFEAELTRQIAAYVRSPHVSATRLAGPADTITVVGAFKEPGIYSLSNHRSLLGVVSSVGGLQPNARTIRITRRLGRPRSGALQFTDDSVAGVSTARIDLARFIEQPGLQEAIIIEPQDVLYAETPGLVFLTGEVLRPGPFELGQRSSFSLAELISLAGGLGRDAAPHKTRVLRPILNGSKRAEIPVDVERILAGGGVADFQILANDIVVVPRAGGKGRTIKTALLWVAPALTTGLIYLAFR